MIFSSLKLLIFGYCLKFLSAHFCFAQPVPKPLSSILRSQSDGPVLVQLRVYYTEFCGVKARKYNGILLTGKELDGVEVHQQIVTPVRSLTVDSVEPQQQEIFLTPQVKGDSIQIVMHTLDSTFPDNQVFVETNDPDLSPEEKQVLEQVLRKQFAKKQRINSLAEHPLSDNLSVLGDCCAMLATTEKDTSKLFVY